MMRWLGVLSPGIAAGAALWGCAAAPPPPVAAPAAPVAVPATPAAAAASPAPTAPPAAQGAALPWRYRCDQGLEFTVRFSDDRAFIDSSRGGREVVLRDAGGMTPQQSVYSNPHLRVEFGLGTSGREAKLRYLPEPQSTHCLLQPPPNTH